MRGVWGVSWPGSEFAVPARIRALGGARGRRRTPVAMVRGRLWLRRRSLLHRRARTGWWAALALAAFGCGNRDRGAPQQLRLSVGAGLRRGSGRLCRRDAAHRVDRPSGAAPPDLERRRDRLCRGARGARAQRPHRRAHAHDRRPPPRPGAAARARRPCAPGTAPPVGSFVTFKADLLPPLAAAAARRLRFRARHVFFAHRRLRLRARRGSRPQRRRSRAAAPGCATPRPSRACATASTSASAPSFPATRAQSPRR